MDGSWLMRRIVVERHIWRSFITLCNEHTKAKMIFHAHAMSHFT